MTAEKEKTEGNCKLQTNCLSVFDHFVKLALKGFNKIILFSAIKKIYGKDM